MVRVLFFGATAQLVGQSEIAVLAQDATVGTIVDRLMVDYPELANLNLLFALNQEFASRETVIGWGGELAIFTAVSGG